MKYKLVLISALFVSSLQVQANPVTDLFGPSAAGQESFLSVVFQNNGKRQPPQKAIDACQNKTEGASCEFEGRHGKVTGTCKTRNDKLVCTPTDRPNKKEHPKKKRKNKD